MPRQSKANRRKTKIKQGLRNPNVDRNDAPTERDLRADSYGPGVPRRGSNRGRRRVGVSRNEAWFSGWLAKGKGSKKRQEVLDSMRDQKGAGKRNRGIGGNGSRTRPGENQGGKRRKLTAREKWGGEHPTQIAKRNKQARGRSRAGMNQEEESGSNSKVGSSIDSVGGVKKESMRQSGESVEDFNARKDREISQIIAGEEFATTKRAAKSKKYYRLMEAKRKRQAEQRRRRAANYDSEEEDWVTAAGGRDDAKFGERIEDAPRFRNKLDESRAFSFLAKKKVVTLIENSDSGSGATNNSSVEGPEHGGKLSKRDQMSKLREQVVRSYRNRR